MKRADLLRHLRIHGCYLAHEGGNHSIWVNTQKGGCEAIPRHNEIPDNLCKKICKGLYIPYPN